MIAEIFHRRDAKAQSALHSRKPVIQSEGSIAWEGEESPPDEKFNWMTKSRSDKMENKFWLYPEYF